MTNQSNIKAAKNQNIIAGTGHRPSNLGGYKIPNPVYNYVFEETSKILLDKKPAKVLTGMAIGYDQMLAEACIKLQIPFIAALPFLGQELWWPKETQKHYHSLLEHAEQVEVISAGGFASWKMQARNKWLVDNCNLLVAAYCGTKGGTHNCIEYAKEIKRNILIIDPTKI